MPNKGKSNNEADERGDEFEATSLDELTHAEMSLLYRESTDTVRFAKHLQWWTVGATLLSYLAAVGIAKMVSADRAFVDKLTMAIILLTMGVIFTLSVYQFWQHTELAKIENISKRFSTLFAEIRKLKSSREANVHRFLLLGFMIVTVLMGAVITHLGLQQLVDHRFQ